MTDPFTLDAARERITQLREERPGETATAVALGTRQIADLEADLRALHGRDTGPLVSLHGLDVLYAGTDDAVALVFGDAAASEDLAPNTAAEQETMTDQEAAAEAQEHADQSGI